MHAVLETVPVAMALAVFAYQVRTRDRVTDYHRVRAPWPFCPAAPGRVRASLARADSRVDDIASCNARSAATQRDRR